MRGEEREKDGKGYMYIEMLTYREFEKLKYERKTERLIDGHTNRQTEERMERQTHELTCGG